MEARLQSPLRHLLGWVLLGSAFAAARAVEIPKPKPVINIPKPTINVPKPTVNVPKPTVQRPSVAVVKPTKPVTSTTERDTGGRKSVRAPLEVGRFKEPGAPRSSGEAVTVVPKTNGDSIRGPLPPLDAGRTPNAPNTGGASTPPTLASTDKPKVRPMSPTKFSAFGGDDDDDDDSGVPGLASAGPNKGAAELKFKPLSFAELSNAADDHGRAPTTGGAMRKIAELTDKTGGERTTTNQNKLTIKAQAASKMLPHAKDAEADDDDDDDDSSGAPPPRLQPTGMAGDDDDDDDDSSGSSGNSNGSKGGLPSGVSVSQNGSSVTATGPNGSYATVTNNGGGSVTLQTGNGSVTLNQQQLTAIANGNLSALGPALGNMPSTTMGGNGGQGAVGQFAPVSFTNNTSTQAGIGPYIVAAGVVAATAYVTGWAGAIITYIWSHPNELLGPDNNNNSNNSNTGANKPPQQ
jgi:hypothetical protein